MRVLLWVARGCEAVLAAILLSQIEFGWYGWTINVIVIILIIGYSFLLGAISFSDEPPMQER